MPEAFKKYVLMHKEVAVAGVELDEATGLITAVYDVSNAAHLPLGVSVRKGIADRAALNEWWMGRAIPASRTVCARTSSRRKRNIFPHGICSIQRQSPTISPCISTILNGATLWGSQGQSRR